MSNMTYTDITTLLNPTSVLAESSVILPTSDPRIAINGVVLDSDVLTYRPGDEKTFTSPVQISGVLRVVSGSDDTKDLTFSSSSNVVLVEDTTATDIYSVNLSER